jgi:hypothetical protein
MENIVNLIRNKKLNDARKIIQNELRARSIAAIQDKKKEVISQSVNNTTNVDES